MKEILLPSLLCLTLLLSCTRQARLIVNPNSTQFSEGDLVTLICEKSQSIPNLTLRRNTSALQRTTCGHGWGKIDGQTCSITLLSQDTGVYWCESRDGSISNKAYIIVTGQKTIRAESGKNATLTCRAPNNKIIVAANWSRADLGDEYVLVYRDGHFDPNHQHPSFKNRVDLQDRQMKDGDVSVILKAVTVNDAGTYVCRVLMKDAKTWKVSSIYLYVVPPGQPGGAVGLIIGLTVSAVLLVAAVVGVFLKKRNRQQTPQ